MRNYTKTLMFVLLSGLFFISTANIDVHQQRILDSIQIAKIQEIQDNHSRSLDSISSVVSAENQRLTILLEKEVIEGADNRQTFWSFLSSFNNYKLLILIPIVLLFIGIFVLFIKPKINLGNGKTITFGLLGAKKKHLGCPISGDFYHVISKVTEITTNQFILEHITKLERQMNYTEQRIALELKAIFMNNFSELLKDKLTNNTEKRADFLYYGRLLDSFLREDAMNFFRYAYKNNHFENITDIEFIKYIKDKSDAFFDLKTQFMDIYYSIVNSSVSRQELKDSVKLLKPLMDEAITNVFTMSKQISITISTEKFLLQKDLENFCNGIITGTPQEFGGLHKK